MSRDAFWSSSVRGAAALALAFLVGSCSPVRSTSTPLQPSAVRQAAVETTGIPLRQTTTPVTEATAAKLRRVYSGRSDYESLLVLVFANPADASLVLGGGAPKIPHASVISFRNVVLFYTREPGVQDRSANLRAALRRVAETQG
jgi:hypothetical protein